MKLELCHSRTGAFSIHPRMSERVRARHNLVTGLRLGGGRCRGWLTPDRIYHVFLSFKFSQIRSGDQPQHVNMSA